MIYRLKKNCSIVTLTLFFSISLFASNNISYSRVLLKTDNGTALFKTLAENDMYIDHAAKSKTGYVVVLNSEEIKQLKEIGVAFEILIEDLEKYQAKRIEAEMQKPEIKQRLSSKRMGFDYGSHAGYNTPAELNAKLDEISNTYPNLAATKVSIGTTYEGRDIYMLKISDNPNTDESATEPAVYYDAMHHAREPLSMMSTLYYMFWLVENYGVDPIATHIINNRELFFVPIVNVDGYEYNITTNPNGGGYWRKNRVPDIGGSGCIGTDPNRNYGADWGGAGASTNPCSDTYRGPSAFSEPCTQATRDFINSINPVMAFSCHSYSEIYIESDWNAANAEQFYADYSLDMCAEHEFGYEQGESLLYAVSGGTTEFLNSVGAISWTPEIGSVFWEPIADIIPYAEKHLPSFIYIAQVAGDFPDVKQAIINNGNDILAGQPYIIDVEVFNKGRTQMANNISLSISSISGNATIVNSAAIVPNVAPRQSVWSNTTNPLEININSNAVAGDIIEVEIAVISNGIEYEKELQRWVVGSQNVLFAEDGSNGLGTFTSINNGYLDWDTTYVMRRSGNESISDSPLQAADNNTLSYLVTSNPINLANTTKPVLEFWIAWGISNFNTYSNSDPSDDNCRLEIQANNGGWNAINADDTQNVNGGPRFVLNNPWAKQIVDLSTYIGNSIEFRFALDASNTSEPDGVFIDDLRVVDYTGNMPTALINGNNTLTICEGELITVNHSSTNFDNFTWYSGDGVSSTLNPATFIYNTQGVYTLSLEVANANGTDTDNITVIVDAATAITLGSIPSSVSVDQPVTLSATPAGGVFSGDGVIFNAFNPSIAGPGLHIITYTYTNNSNCTSTASTNIFVFDVSYVFVNYNLGTISPKIIGSSKLVIDARTENNYNIGVYDVMGRAVYTEQVMLQNGIQNTALFPFKNLKKGLYIFTIGSGSNMLSEKIYLTE